MIFKYSNYLLNYKYFFNLLISNKFNYSEEIIKNH